MRNIILSAKQRRVILARRRRIRLEIAEETVRDRDVRIAELEAQLDKKSK